MDKYYYVNAENGYVIIDGKLVNVKLDAVVTKQEEDSLSVSLRCVHNGNKFEVQPNDFYLTREAFELSVPVTPQICPLAGKIRHILFGENGIYSFVIGDNGIPYKKYFNIDYVESSFIGGSRKVYVPGVDDILYPNMKSALENTTYTEVCADGTEHTHVGLSKLLELTDEQKGMLADINSLLKKLYDSGVMLERTNCNEWYAINTQRVESARIVSEWTEDEEWNPREGEETVNYCSSLKVDMNLNYEHAEDSFCIRVKR